jgi:hypothetical protein
MKNIYGICCGTDASKDDITDRVRVRVRVRVYDGPVDNFIF